ncbi:MAG: DUF3750 domain-containing protein [Candidatus Pacebacteria bacterium]|nr:DUF3750 domain-containing protein [Candidatus Paceibacterota bacterium]
MKSLPINNDPYQVYFFTCPIRGPFSFAVHPWVVFIKNNKVTRLEVLAIKNEKYQFYGYIHKNLYNNPTKGLRKLFKKNEFLKSTLLGSISGNKNSTAKHLIDFIEEMTPFYPHQENYVLYPGPNSNTYIAWILQKFPELKIKLPWNAFGKNFK